MGETAHEEFEVWGSAEAKQHRLRLRVERARPHTLVVKFADRHHLPVDGRQFDRLLLSCNGREENLGPCVYEQRSHRVRRKDDPPAEPGDGRLSFLERVYDFRQLFRTGRVIDLGRKVEQLPLVWNRRASVRPAFRDFVSNLLYELQVYRGVFDDLDRNLETEPVSTRQQIQQVAVETQYPAFREFFDQRLQALAVETSAYTRQEHELHGFYLRKQLWDLILSSEFLARTNLKPRGYAGDSTMMRMIYENEFRGKTVFSKFMHRHPLESVAASAVRNRRKLVADAIAAAHRRRTQPGKRTRILSVACGPAWELHDVFSSRDDFDKYEIALLDQDPLALDEAAESLRAVEASHGARTHATLHRDSVRTMLGDDDLPSRWGKFQLIYSMGLFDYLTRPVARAVLARLYALLAPGGELVIGNFHPNNPTRVYMEYWMDWVLCYRVEDELLELATTLPGAVSRVGFEPSGSQMLLSVMHP